MVHWCDCCCAVSHSFLQALADSEGELSALEGLLVATSNELAALAEPSTLSESIQGALEVRSRPAAATCAQIHSQLLQSELAAEGGNVAQALQLQFGAEVAEVQACRDKVSCCPLNEDRPQDSDGRVVVQLTESTCAAFLASSREELELAVS